MKTEITHQCENGKVVRIRLLPDGVEASIDFVVFGVVPLASVKTATLIFSGRVIFEAYRNPEVFRILAPRAEVRALASLLRDLLTTEGAHR